jgi:hypothetical protein
MKAFLIWYILFSFSCAIFVLIELISAYLCNACVLFDCIMIIVAIYVHYNHDSGKYQLGQVV